MSHTQIPDREDLILFVENDRVLSMSLELSVRRNVEIGTRRRASDEQRESYGCEAMRHRFSCSVKARIDCATLSG